MRLSRQKTYYEMLGVPRHATPEEIQHRYHQWARKYHPDVAEDKANAQSVFARITAIYEVLHDPQRRAEYDRSLTADATTQRPPRSPLESPAMERLLSEAEGDALAADKQFEQALLFYRLARGRQANPSLEAKIARAEAAALAGHWEHGEGVPRDTPEENKRPFWQRWFRRD